MIRHTLSGIIFPFFVVLILAIIWMTFSPEKKMTSNFSSPPSPEVKRSPILVKGSIPYWDQEAGVASLKNKDSQLNLVSVFWYFLTDDGQIAKYRTAKEDRSIIEFSHKNSVRVLATITNLPEDDGTTWDSERVELILEDDKLIDSHIEDIKKKLTEFNFDGVIIDYEEVKAEPEKFTNFIQKLSQSLKKERKILAVALHPKFGELKDSRYQFQDWKELSRYADQLYIMAYGEHWDEGAAGPVASYPWVKKIVDYAKSLKIPSEKIFLGLPLYGYEWEEDSDEDARGLTYQDVLKIIKENGINQKWDEEAKSPYLEYRRGSHNFEVWYEDATSAAQKIKLAYDAGFGGVNFWRLGGEDKNIWNIVSEFKD